MFECRPERRTHARGAAGGVQARRALIGPLGSSLRAPVPGRDGAARVRRVVSARRAVHPLMDGARGLMPALEKGSGFNVLAPITSRLFPEAWPTAGGRLRERRGPGGKVGSGAGDCLRSEGLGRPVRRGLG